LERFAVRRDEAAELAFAALVERHGPMVRRVCRGVLRDPHDAEDAFQATFLVLVRKAASVRPRRLVGPWLYGVARMTAVRARAAAAKRRAREAPLVDVPDPAPRPDADLAAVIDEELARLPEKYRVPIVLCDLGGQSHREAAEQLGWPQGTVSGRLFRGRQLLATRLARRGVTTTAAAAAAVLAGDAAAARVPPALWEATGNIVATGLVPAEVAALSEGVAKTMLLTKLKLVVPALAVLAVVGVGALGLRSTAADPPEQKAAPPAAQRPAAPKDRIAAALEDYRQTLAVYDLGFDSVFPGRAWQARDPKRLDKYPSRDAWPQVLGHVDTGAGDFAIVPPKGPAPKSPSGGVAFTGPLAEPLATNDNATLLCLDGITADGVVTAKGYASVVCHGTMAGKLFFASYATAYVKGDMTGNLTAQSYFNAVVTGKFTGRIWTDSYAMIYLMGGFAGEVELGPSHLYIAGRTTKADLARLKSSATGNGDVYLEESDLPAGTQTVNGVKVTVAKTIKGP
ncbi:MAG TPA: sigma-70 family RNA polymerase sigma factor, partial [Gemmataceae bacterium]